jgi:hypothetical protein
MKQKVVFILALFYSVQLIIACCPEETIENTIRDVSVRPFTLQDNTAVDVMPNDVIDKEALIMTISLEGDQIRIGSLFNEFQKIGPQSAYAAIDCFNDPIFVYKNNVERIEVIAVDTNNAESDVTGDMVIFGSDQSIASYVSENQLTVLDRFEVEFSNTNNIPATASFKIQVFLDDGTVAVTETDIINFS